MRAWLTQAGRKAGDLAWSAYEHAPQPLVDAAGQIKPFLQVLNDCRVPLAILRGPIADGKGASLLVAGAGHSIEYMVGQFFAQPPQRESIETIPLPALSRTLRRLRGSTDMTIAQVPRLLAGWMDGREYLRVPPWVGVWLRVPKDPETFVRRNKRLWDELRPMRQHDLRALLSHDIADFDRFYNEFYRPFALHRFGDSAAVRPLKQLRRLLRRDGALMWICSGEERLAGVLFSPLGKTTMRMISLGVAGTGERARKLGAVPAAYYHGIELARSRGCTLMDLGASRPSPADGVLYFKRKWGVYLAPRVHVLVDLLLRWEQPNHAIRSFLSRTPLIIRQANELALLAAPEDHDLDRARRLLLMKGLQRMYVINGQGETNNLLMPGLSQVELLKPALLEPVSVHVENSANDLA